MSIIYSISFSLKTSCCARDISLLKNLVHFWQKSFCFQENSSKIRENPFVLKISRTLFQVSEMPLVAVFAVCLCGSQFVSVSLVAQQSGHLLQMISRELGQLLSLPKAFTIIAFASVRLILPNTYNIQGVQSCKRVP